MKLIRSTLFLLPVLTLPVSVRASVIHVPGIQPTVQAGLDVAGSGDTVLVAPGIYAENLVWGSSQSGVILLSTKGPDSTTIDGGLADPVIRCTDLGPGTRIEGFTIANGRATSILFGNSLGGGIYLNNADVTVTGNVIRDNIAFSAGGGLYARYSSPVISGNRFENNSASNGLGGGAYSGDGENPLIEDNEFVGNTAYSGGGGVALSRSPGIVRRNSFVSNQATTLGSGGGVIVSASSDVEILENQFESNGGAGGGGAIYVTRSSPLIQANQMVSNTAGLGGGAAIYCNESSSPEIRENLLVSNASSVAGGGIAVADTSNPMIISNTLVSNSAALGGGGIYVTLQSNPTITGNILVGSPTGNGIEITADASAASLACNDVWNNQPANYSGLADPTGVDGNISQDPEFCEPGSGNYRLVLSSPCAAANAPSGCGRMGALEEGCNVVSIEPGSPPGAIRLYQNVPNPVRGRTLIRFELSRSASVRLAIYNVAGRLVRLAYDGRRFPAGVHQWSWDGRGDRGNRVSSGVYFYVLQAENLIGSRRLIFLE